MEAYDQFAKGILSNSVAYCCAIYLAAQNGHKDVVKYITDLPVALDESEFSAATTFFLAAQKGNLNIIKYFFQNDRNNICPNVDANVTDTETAVASTSVETEEIIITECEEEEGWDPLGNAMEKGNAKRFMELLKDEDEFRFYNHKNFLFHLAVKNGNVTFVDILLERKFYASESNDFDETPIHLAIVGGNLDIIDSFLKAEVALYNLNKRGDSVFHIAAKHGRADVLSMLLRNTPFRDFKNKFGETAVMCSKNPEVLDLFIKHGANIKALAKKKNNMIHTAIKYNHYEVIDALIQKGISINAQNSHHANAVHQAAFYGRYECMAKILDNGGDVNKANNDSKTPLLIAMERGHVLVAELLLIRGASLEQKNNGWTPLHFAAYKGHENMIDLLLNKGACIEAKTNFKKTPLHLAAENENVAAVKLLLTRGANVHAKDCNRRTPLHSAAINGHIRSIDLLIEHKANLFAKDEWKQNPEELARLNGHGLIALFLSVKSMS